MGETDEIRERIKQIMNKVDMTAIAFAESIGIQQSTLSHILNGRNRPSLDVVMKIHSKFPDINYSWLISGEGEMVKSSMIMETELYSRNNDVFMPGLFDDNKENTTIGSTTQNFRKENGLNTPLESNKNIVRQDIKFVEKPPRKITEIRIFFDDNTFQIFQPVNNE